MNLNPNQFGSHEDLVKDALRSWKGSPTDFTLRMRDAVAGVEPQSLSGREKHAQALALHHEVTNAPPTSRTLYRGAATAPEGITGWTTRRTVAEGWARRYQGAVHVLPKGGGRGIRVADHITNGLDDHEKEWLVHAPKGYSTYAPPPRRAR